MKWRWQTVNEWIEGRDYIVGAEIGVKEGRFTRFMLENNDNLTMYAIDPWEKQPGKEEDYREWDWTDIYTAFRERMKPFPNRVTEIMAYSKEAAAVIADNSLDFVFIDAQHDFLSVREDIKLWEPKVKKGGLICGHDYCDKFPGVVAAVHDRFKNPMKGANDCWGQFL